MSDSLALWPEHLIAPYETILCIDYGSKVCGLASFCFEADPFPTPYGRIIYQSDDSVISELLKIISLMDIQVLVLGLPLYLDGNLSKMSKRVLEFSLALKKSLSLPLFLQDEVLSSVAATQRMKESAQYNFRPDPKKIDQVAATIILESFLTDYALKNRA